MSIEWFLYLADITNGLNTMFGVIGVLTFLSGVGLMFFRYISLHTENSFPFSKPLLITMIISGFIFLMISNLIPSEKTIYLIAGAHEIKQSDIPAKVEAVIEKKLDEYLKEDDK